MEFGTGCGIKHIFVVSKLTAVLFSTAWVLLASRILIATDKSSGIVSRDEARTLLHMASAIVISLSAQ